jgi:MFS transporter, DHA2 family, multidrug resistance protein
MLDRGELKDWFGSTEIWIEAILAALCLYLFIVHTVTAGDRSFLNRLLLRDANCVGGTVLMFLIGIPLYGTMTLLPTMMQSLMNYPVITAGFVTAPRGVGTMIGMIVVTRLSGKLDIRFIIFIGMVLSAVALWQMTGFSLQMGMGPLITSGLLQGFGLGFVFTQLSVATFSTLPRAVLTQGSAMFSLMRNLGGSAGISIVEALLVENTQIVHSQLAEHVRPDNPLAQAPYLAAPYSLTNLQGIAALNHEITRQAQMISYIDDFHLMMIVIVVALPFLLLLRRAKRPADSPAIVVD